VDKVATSKSAILRMISNRLESFLIPEFILPYSLISGVRPLCEKFLAEINTQGSLSAFSK
jgi:hypothetical protein